MEGCEGANPGDGVNRSEQPESRLFDGLPEPWRNCARITLVVAFELDKQAVRPARTEVLLKREVADDGEAAAERISKL